MRPLRALTRASAPLAAVALVGALAACSGYPDGWGAIDHRGTGLARTGCPDLSGTWRLHPGAKGGRPYSQSVIERQVRNRERQRWQWETVTIAGDPDDSITLSLRRAPETIARFKATTAADGRYFSRQYETLQSPERRWQDRFGEMSDGEYAENLSKMTIWPELLVTLRAGQDYVCEDGWLVGDRLVHDPGPDRSAPRPDTVIGVVRLARQVSGHLVFNAVFDERKEFYLWCGDGCRGVPLGTWETNEWSRLEPTEAPPVEPVPRPWSAPFRTEGLRVARGEFAPAQPAAEIRAAVERVLPGGVSVVDVQRDGSTYRARIASGAGTAPFHGALKALVRTDSVHSIHVVALDSLGEGRWELSVRLGVTARAATPAQASALEQRVRAALAPHGTVERARGSGDAVIVNVLFAQRARYVAALNVLRADASLAFQVLEAGQVGDEVRAAFSVRPRPAP